ncbi:TRAP transporter small permease [Primorskyibacter sp. 2E233]|uniref:TRAP transporter small permease n=1 Tax=Primorskyibacter sp. 2E233 TaxID=3413431 RepID=UPI003BF20099
MQSFIRRLSYGMAYLSGGLLLLVAGIMFVDVIGRYVFNAPLTFSVELVQLLMGLAIAFGLALTTLRREHIRVDLVTQISPPWLRRVLDLLADLAGLMFFGLVAWKMFDKALQTMSDGLFTQILSLPVYPVVTVMCLAAAIAFVVAALLILRPQAGRSEF